MTDFLGLRDQVIAVTGAASGMGRAVANAASREGAGMVLADFDGDRLVTMAGELKNEVRYGRADESASPVSTPGRATRRCTRRSPRSRGRWSPAASPWADSASRKR